MKSLGLNYELILKSSRLELVFSGALNRQTLPAKRNEILQDLRNQNFQELYVSLQKIDSFDTSAIVFLQDLEAFAAENECDYVLNNCSQNLRQMYELYSKTIFAGVRVEKPEIGFVARVGETFLNHLKALRQMIAFIGELSFEFVKVLVCPKNLRWKDVWLVVEKSGVESLPIIIMIGFLVGLIMSFQAAIPMKQFGADIFIADLVSLSLLRELGPLMTAIILAGRSGSAFAAEIGTMKVNEEVNALKTMGINPLRFLVLNKVVAVVMLTPILTVVMSLAGLIGGVVVFKSLGYPLVTYYNKVVDIIRLSDFLGGIVKSFAFGLLIAAIGCFRGLETKDGASAVGDSATKAVVSGIILIVITDGIFSVLYYYLGI